jgi:serine/threonine protein phosphatase 1
MDFIRHKYVQLNVLGTDYVVSDIHGNYSALMESLNKLDFNPAKDRLFSVGDIIDRGNESEDCLRLLQKPWFIPVLANHELTLIEFIDCSELIDTIRKNGGQWINKYLDSPSIIRRWVELIKLRMPIAITIETNFGKVGITHAQPPLDWIDVTNAMVDATPFITSRDQIRHAEDVYVKNITYTVHGHTSVNKPTLISNRFWIDTLEDTGTLCIKSLDQLKVELDSHEKKRIKHPDN